MWACVFRAPRRVDPRPRSRPRHEPPRKAAIRPNPKCTSHATSFRPHWACDSCSGFVWSTPVSFPPARETARWGPSSNHPGFAWKHVASHDWTGARRACSPAIRSWILILVNFCHLYYLSSVTMQGRRGLGWVLAVPSPRRSPSWSRAGLAVGGASKGDVASASIY